MSEHHSFQYEIGSAVIVDDPNNIFMRNIEVEIVEREFFNHQNMEVYIVKDKRGWTSAVRSSMIKQSNGEHK